MALKNLTSGIRPKYQVTIDDGVNQVGIISHTADTPSARAIRRLPRGAGVERKAIVQSSFSGGRGGYRFSPDPTKFYDSGRAWTMVDGYAISGPLARVIGGIPLQFGGGGGGGPHRLESDQPGGSFAGGFTSGVQYYPLSPSDNLARQVSVIPGMTAASFSVIIRKVGTPAGPLTISLWTDDGAGNPFGPIAGTTVSIPASDPSLNELSRWVTVAIPTPLAMVSGTLYWIVVGDPNRPNKLTQPHWEVATHYDGGSEPSGFASVAGGPYDGTWYNVHQALYWILEDSGYTNVGNMHFFEYKRALYVVTQPDDGSAARLFLNGYRGVANGAGSDSSDLKDALAAWPASIWGLQTLLITAGALKGKWAIIGGNSGTLLVLQSAFPTPIVANVSEYVILGSEVWTEITATGLTAPVTSVEVMNGIVYFAQGNGVNIRRMQEFNNAGVWTRNFADDGANRADFLTVFADEITGAIKLYRAKNDDVTFSRADKKAWGTNLTFDASVAAGDTESNITGMTVYNNQVYLGKEDEIGLVKNDLWTKVPVPIRAGRDEHNGQNLIGWNTNLYFPFLDGFERLYGQVVDDIGPNRQEGMPVDRRGRVSDFKPVLQYGYAAIDAGLTGGISSIVATTSPGGDWHELYRAFGANRPIRNLFYQSVPGRENRLWFSEGNGWGYLMLPRDTHTPLNDAAMRYSDQSYITTSWYDADTADLDHYWDELRIFSRNLGATPFTEIRVDYQIDNDTLWTQSITTLMVATTSPHATLPVGLGLVTGHRIRFRLRMYTGRPSIPVVVNALDVRLDIMHEVLYDYILDFQMKDRIMLISGGDSKNRALGALNQLAAWQENATLLNWHCVIPAFDNKVGHIDPVSLVPRSWQTNNVELAGSITFKET